jgi:6-pyruvoyltetrahydropterin/6-carboxytetrahydropterin synthase
MAQEKSRTTLHLAKQNFKFSSAHFLIFDEKRAERLHGHNYKVRLDIGFQEEVSEQGYFTDFNVFKTLTKKALDAWDEMILLPKNHPDMKVQQDGPSLKINFRDRFYVFPKNEVVLLPVTNTSTEQLSKLLAETLFTDFKKLKVSQLRVYVEETPGQGAATVVSKK